jgi:hypothetical protein
MAHDFWVQPDEYWLLPQALTGLTLQVGHGPSRQRSPIALSRITRFETIASNGQAMDVRSHLRLGDDAEDGDIRFEAPGAYVLVLETDSHAQSHLPAIVFNDYLQAEGLTPALELRKWMHRMNTDGSERYSRQTKAIVQVGSPNAASQAQITRPLGLQLEIVPELSPYTAPRGTHLPVRVIYESQPLAGALVKLTDLDHDAAPVEALRTDESGRAIFTMPSRGRWLLNVVWTKALTSTEDTEYETVFSSLSFGFPQTQTQ